MPADMLYSTVTPQRYRELVDLAVEANFNMLRVWGGGCFTDHALCEACDEAGMLVWHDFLFACAKYPGDYPEFAAEVRAIRKAEPYKGKGIRYEGEVVRRKQGKVMVK